MLSLFESKILLPLFECLQFIERDLETLFVQVIDLLSSNYIAVAQMANLMAEWLILAGAEIQTVQQLGATLQILFQIISHEY